MTSTSGATCGQCGAINQVGTAFCVNCGQALSLVAPAGPPPGPPAGPPPGPLPRPLVSSAPPAQPAYPAYPAYPAPVPATTPAAVSGGSRVVPFILAVVGLLLATGVVVWSLAGPSSTSTSSGAGEIFLESAASIGTSPFTEPVDPTPVTTAAPPSTAASTTAAATATTPTTPPATVAPVAAPTSGVAPAPGSPPYGGTGDDKTCDRGKLLTFLQANGDRARAWAGVLGIATADIPTYVRGLTPTVLLYDTRVTNHGFANGQATTLQSILQAGTAVLVDSRNNPVVRCRCGNPLTPPAPVARPVVVGTPWPGYRPGVAVAVNNGVTVTVVINVNTTPSGAPATTTAPTSTLPPTTPSTTSSSTTPESLSIPPSSTTAPSTGPTSTTTRAGLPASPQDVEGLLAVLAECAPGDAQILDVRKEPDLPDTYTVLARVKGVEMLFTYTKSTGTITEGDKASADLLQQCGFVR